MSSEQDVERRACVACGKSVRTGATLCPHCGARQQPGWDPSRLAALAGAGVTILSLMFGSLKLLDAYEDWSATKRYVNERLAAAQTLSEARDFTSAWTAIEEAHRADPGSVDVRATQLEVAVQWLVDGQPVPVAWVWTQSASSPDPATGPGAAAERVSPALVVADALGEESGNAEIIALLTWARFLRSMEVLAERRNFAPEFERALARDSASPLANLFLAHWLTVMEYDIETAQSYWQQALETGKRSQVRRFQIAALMRLASLRDRQRTAEDALLGGILLTVLADMRKEDERLPGTFEARELVTTYFDPLGPSDWFGDLRSAPTVSEQLATLDWIERNLGAMEFSSVPRQLQYIRGRLIESEGQVESALDAYHAAAKSEWGDRLASRAEADIERLSHAPSPAGLTGDPWRLHRHHVRTQNPGQQGFEAALAAIFEHSEIMLEIGDPSLSGKFPPVLKGAIASYTQWIERSSLSVEAKARANERLRELLIVRGLYNNRFSRYEDALRDFETVILDVSTSPEMLSFVLANLARVYADRSRIPDMSTDFGEALWQADIEEGFDRLRVAVAYGFDDWEWVEKHLAPLHGHPAYAAFSIAHGRVPPRADPR